MLTFIIFLSSVGGWVALVSVLIHYFSPAGKCVKYMSVSKSVPSIESNNFLLNAAVASGAELTYFNAEQCEILSDNRTWYLSLTKDVEHASRSIYISTYIWEADEVSGEFFAALVRAVKRGVEVRLLMDDFGNSLSKEVIQKLKDGGIKVKRFRPLKFGKLSFYFSRNHRRSYIFDEEVAYIGGASVSKRWFVRPSRKFSTYNDVMYRYSGSAVRQALAAFGELWTATGGEVLQFPLADVLTRGNEYYNSLFLNHAPRVDIHPYTYLLWYSCMVAKKSIVLCSPYMLPGEAMSQLLIQKAKAGVSVTLITQGTNEIWFVSEAGRSYYEQFLQAGITIYECQGNAHLHAKISIVDDSWSMVGSANFDTRSQRINHESILGVQSKSFAERNMKILGGYIATAKQIDLKEWQRRPFYKKILEQSLSFFSEQM